MGTNSIGTVTLLFTDLVASTQLRVKLGDDDAEAVRRAHFDAMRDAVQRHQGREVKTTGDGFMVAFSSSLHAIECAIAMQQAVHAANASLRDDRRLQLRIGLDAGEVTQEDGDYFGTPVVVAKRLCDLAEGGQILVSQLVRGLVGSRGGVGFVSKGELAAKGLDPISAWEVPWEPVPDASPVEAEAGPPPPRRGTSAIKLPGSRTEVIGREDEIARLVEALAEPGRRLVTLIGPGGIGKTTLAVEAARRFTEAHTRDVAFAALDAVPSVDRLPIALGDALEIPQLGQASPEDSLLEFLRTRELLLVLDNFEHLLDGASLVADILGAAPEVKLLVTSREALGLREEWRFAVSGLTTPEAAGGDDARAFPAVQLFARRAEQARRDFSLEHEAAHVARICRLLDGVPLAIELAASWVSTLSCAEIVEAIEASVDLLETSLRDVPERHRSLRGVFEQSWSRLSEDEQRVFERLSVFRGGFDRQAAGVVAGASLPVLQSFVDKSLVQPAAEGRYRLHEMLRQCAEEKLAASPEAVAAARVAHCAHYISFVEGLVPGIAGGRQLEAAEELARELDNVLFAWACALDERDGEKLGRAAATLAQFYQFRGRYAEAKAMFTAATRSLAAGERTPELAAAMVVIAVEAGWFLIRLGLVGEAKSVLQEGLAVHEEIGSPSHPGFASDPLSALAVVALIEGDYDAAEELGRRAVAAHEAAANDWNLALALYTLASAHSSRGQYEEARALGLRAYDLTRKNGDRWFMAYCLNELGLAAAGLGEHDAAKEYYSASYEVRREFGDPEGMAVALNRLGDLAMAQGAHIEAGDRYRRALSIYRDINDRGGLADALRGLGESSRTAGSYRQAARYQREALSTARSIGHVPMTLAGLAGAGELLLAIGKEELGSGVLAFVAAHPRAERQTVERIQDRALGPSADLPQDLDDLAAAIDAELLALEEHAEPAVSDQAFVEPLTEREREILERVAAGRSNREIAEELVISIGTVKAHTSNIYGKLGAQNRVQAITRARELALLPPI